MIEMDLSFGGELLLSVRIFFQNYSFYDHDLLDSTEILRDGKLQTELKF